MAVATQEPEPKTATTEPGSVAGTEPKGTTPEQTYSEADLDRLTQKALKTREANLKAEADARVEKVRKDLEERQLAEQGKHKELAENYKAELSAMQADKAAAELKAQTAEMLGKKNLSALSLIFDQDLGSLGGREVATEALTKIIDDTVDVRVKERLGTPQPPRGSGGKTPAAQTDSERLKKRYPTMAADPKWAGLM